MDIPLRGTIDPFDMTKRVETAKRAVSAAEREDRQLKQASRDFEGIFLGMMLKSMRSTLSGETLVSGGYAEEIFESMMDQQMVTDISRGESHLGFGEMIYRQLTRKEESDPNG